MDKQLASPFKEIFQNEQIADWAFDFLKEASYMLDVMSSGDPRLSVTYSEDKKRISYNFCNWKIISFRGDQEGRVIIRISLLVEKWKQLSNQVKHEEDFPFASNPLIGSYKFLLSDFNESSSIIMPLYKETMEEIRRRFANFKKGPFKKFHRNELGQAILNPSYRKQLFQKGLPPVIKPTKSPKIWWVNQGDSLKEEVEAGIIWAGTDFDGPFRKMVRELEIGDIVIHYAKGKVRYVSQVLSSPEVVPKPVAGSEPDELGYLVRVQYFELSPHIPKELFTNDIRELDIFQGPVQKDNNIKMGYCFRFNQEGLHILQSVQPETSWPDFALVDGREPNYWVFQCSPDVFDFVQAVKDQKLKTWRVAAHKNKIQKGDKVILWLTGSQSGCYALARVSSEVSKQSEHPEEQLYYRTQQVTEETERCEIEIEYSLVDQPIMKELVRNNPILKDLNAGHQGTNFVATKEQYEELLRLATERKLQPRYSFEDLCSETGLAEEDLTMWLRAIERKGQAILYGPPGTGKTFVAKRLAKYIVSETDGLVDLVQFHPAYSYEDFIQGIRPQNNGEGNLVFHIKSGHFLEFCKKAAQRSGTCVFIIDEINRANLSRVFGELMYALEYRNEEVVLASGEVFKIPRNVRIIGTMNTADRSIALVDHALRRRFAFLNLKPNYEVLTRYHQQYGLHTSELIKVLTKLNQSISDPNYEIGISFFMVENLREELKHIWKMEIEPYLEEYFFAQSDVLNRFRWDRVKEQIKW